MKKTWAIEQLLDGWNWKDRAAFGVAALVILICGVVFAFRGLKLNADVWSAIANWVQAIGSIVAIIASAMIVRYQLREQRDLEKERLNEIERLRLSRCFQMLLAATVQGHGTLTLVRKELDSTAPNWKRISTNFESLGSFLLSITPEEFPTPGLAVLVRTVSMLVVRQGNLTREISERTGEVGVDLDQLKKLAENLDTQFKNIQGKIVTEIEKILTEEEKVEFSTTIRKFEALAP